MQVTGVQLREALRAWTSYKQICRTAFRPELFGFDGEEKQPAQVAKRLREAMMATVILQSAQQSYNALVTDNGRPLTILVKLVSELAGLAKMWRLASYDNGESYRSQEPRIVRERNSDTADKTVAPEYCIAESLRLEAEVSEIRQAIARLNQQSIDLCAPGLTRNILAGPASESGMDA